MADAADQRRSRRSPFWRRRGRWIVLVGFAFAGVLVTIATTVPRPTPGWPPPTASFTECDRLRVLGVDATNPDGTHC